MPFYMICKEIIWYQDGYTRNNVYVMVIKHSRLDKLSLNSVKEIKSTYKPQVETVTCWNCMYFMDDKEKDQLGGAWGQNPKVELK